MKKAYLIFLFAALAGGIPAFAQKWEVGGGVGGSFFTSETFKNSVSSADASLSDGVAASIWLGNNTGDLLGGEFRYDYEHTNLTLGSAGTNVSFAAQTHAVHYDFLLHFTPREAKVRPFVAAGGGFKLYRGTGQEQAYQPLSNLGLLTKTNQIEGLLSVGGGVKFALTNRLQFRVEAHDYLTPFPKSVIAPAQGVKAGGWLQDFVVMAGLSFTL
jgi:hypothetical protein